MSSNLTKILSGEPLPLIPASFDPDQANWARTVNLYLEALSGTFQSENVSTTATSSGKTAITENVMFNITGVSSGSNSDQNFITNNDVRGRDFQMQIYCIQNTVANALSATQYDDTAGVSTSQWKNTLFDHEHSGSGGPFFSIIGFIPPGCASSSDQRIASGEYGSTIDFEIWVDSTTGRAYVTFDTHNGNQVIMRFFTLLSDQVLRVTKDIVTV